MRDNVLQLVMCDTDSFHFHFESLYNEFKDFYLVQCLLLWSSEFIVNLLVI